MSGEMDLTIQYAFRFVGTPYKWGGNSPVQGGIDCSGFVCEILKAAGVIPGRADFTAQELFNMFERNGTMGVYGPGVLAFYGESVTKVRHVAFMISTYRIIEAGGGGPQTHTIADAAAREAMVRVRLVDERKDLVATIRPRYSSIGIV